MYLSGLFYSTAVLFPLIIGLYCKRINAQGAFAAIASTVVIGIFSELFLAGKAPGILGIPQTLWPVMRFYNFSRSFSFNKSTQ